MADEAEIEPDYIQTALREAQLESHGSWTLNWDQARQRLTGKQKPLDPLLRLLQAAVAWGCEGLHIHTPDLMTCSVSFVGGDQASLPLRQLANQENWSPREAAGKFQLGLLLLCARAPRCLWLQRGDEQFPLLGQPGKAAPSPHLTVHLSGSSHYFQWNPAHFLQLSFYAPLQVQWDRAQPGGAEDRLPGFLAAQWPLERPASGSQIVGFPLVRLLSLNRAEAGTLAARPLGWARFQHPRVLWTARQGCPVGVLSWQAEAFPEAPEKSTCGLHLYLEREPVGLDSAAYPVHCGLLLDPLPLHINSAPGRGRVLAVFAADDLSVDLDGRRVVMDDNTRERLAQLTALARETQDLAPHLPALQPPRPPAQPATFPLTVGTALLGIGCLAAAPGIVVLGIASLCWGGARLHQGHDQKLRESAQPEALPLDLRGRLEKLSVLQP